MVVSDDAPMRDLLERLRSGWELMDPDAALACFENDPGTIVIGTDAPEYWVGFAALVQPFRSMTEAFSEARYAWTDPGPSIEVMGDTAWAAGVLKASFRTADGWVDLPMRTSVVARRQSTDDWKIRHAHFSLASAEPVAY